jgi:hypothetical protein
MRSRKQPRAEPEKIADQRREQEHTQNTLVWILQDIVEEDESDTHSSDDREDDTQEPQK